MKMSADTGAEAAQSDAIMGAEDEGTLGEEPPTGPEEEMEIHALPPATTPRFTFVANSDRSTLTRIAVDTLRVDTTSVGAGPTQVVISPDYTRAVTFNAEASSLSVVDATTLEVEHIDIRPNRNRMVTSPDGRWALCFLDVDLGTAGATGGAQSFNEISLVDIDELREWPMVTGENPQEARFSDDSSVVVIVSKSHLTRVDLTEDEPRPVHVELVPDVLDPPSAEEFVLTPDGSAAVVRLFGLDELVHIDLGAMTRTTLEVGDNPTDLDMTPDGTQLVAVARGSNELWIYELDDPDAPATIMKLPDEITVGSIAFGPGGERAVLYSTASGESAYALWDRATDEFTARELVKPVVAVGINPTGSTALVTHSAQDPSDGDPNSPYAGKPALSLIDLDTLFSTVLSLPAKPTSFAHTADGETGFFIMEDQPYLEVLDFPTLVHEEVELKSMPVFLGTLPETRTAFISQDHHLGRISFFDPDEARLQTVTGFELNAEIED
jgi:DNA-binding beta-propeller fold protein YncE